MSTLDDDLDEHRGLADRLEQEATSRRLEFGADSFSAEIMDRAADAIRSLVDVAAAVGDREYAIHVAGDRFTVPDDDLSRTQHRRAEFLDFAPEARVVERFGVGPWRPVERQAAAAALPGPDASDAPNASEITLEVMTAERYAEAVQLERSRQVAEEGFDAARDRDHGVIRLLAWSQDYARRARVVQAGALIEAAREQLRALVDELASARASGGLFTYGEIQRRLAGYDLRDASEERDNAR